MCMYVCVYDIHVYQHICIWTPYISISIYVERETHRKQGQKEETERWGDLSHWGFHHDTLFKAPARHTE